MREELDAAVVQMRCTLCTNNNVELPSLLVQNLSTRGRLKLLQKEMLQTNQGVAAILLQAYLKFEEHIRNGKSDLTAGRLVSQIFYSKESRSNASNSHHTRLYWYRYRSRALIVGYRYFLTTGQVLPENRGRCKGKSLIHDPVVKRWCTEIIADMPKAWSARTFRDKISEKLRNEGMVMEGCKIGRSTTTYYLHELGMELVSPKKGIYKDGHERPDTVQVRKEYTAKLRQFKDREIAYTGEQLQTLMPPSDGTLPEIIRVYHDECCYASHEGALTLWLPRGTQAAYKKPRGQIIMCSGFNP